MLNLNCNQYVFGCGFPFLNSESLIFVLLFFCYNTKKFFEKEETDDHSSSKDKLEKEKFKASRVRAKDVKLGEYVLSKCALEDMKNAIKKMRPEEL
mmetsp:Transcript_54839/g.114738  ORF Transcript_54839/g.114738 Transcript_54839/m.114738 type:complete len:96 (+) Transcript_54839:4764-5051(+)